MSDTLTASHYPRTISDGIQWRTFCTCGFMTDWKDRKNDAEILWGEHGAKTIQRNLHRKSFSIIGNPLAKGSEN